jgi:hypothetical protein
VIWLFLGQCLRLQLSSLSHDKPTRRCTYPLTSLARGRVLANALNAA